MVTKSSGHDIKGFIYTVKMVFNSFELYSFLARNKNVKSTILSLYLWSLLTEKSETIYINRRFCMYILQKIKTMF